MEHVPGTPPPDLAGQDEPDFEPATDNDDPEGTYLGDRHYCRHCDGTGGDRMNDGILPCAHCDGEGYYWWRP